MMSILQMLYQILIGPLELLFEIVFSLANRVVDNPGYAIIFLSLAMNFLVLPLYRRADAMQEAERDRAAEMQPVVDHIKKTFKGDERFMMLQAYYREIGYKQTDALKGSVSLLLEIPFFIAAYHFLSNLELLKGVSFGPIVNLGTPDALIQIGDISINFLPILMTAINVVSAAIYMKGFPLKSKVQMYGIAAIFLILLYASPAGLVFYWTLNNVFSLLKNIFYKLKQPGFVLAVLVSLAGLVGLVYILGIYPMTSVRRQVFLIGLFLLLQIPIIVSLIRRKSNYEPKLKIPPATRRDSFAFLFCCAFVALLTGLLVPSALIADSPLEFIDLGDYFSPLWYVASSFLVSLGTFVIWFGIFYWLMSPSGKKCFSAVMFVVACATAVDYMFFGTGYGNISPALQFDVMPAASREEMLTNLAALCSIFGVCIVVYWKKPAFVRVIAGSMCLAVIVMSIISISAISSATSSFGSEELAVKQHASIPLSRQSKNVVVLMLDRSASCLLPEILNEKPELRKTYDGFTYYPNTISYATTTNYGIPGLFGGYEYIPEAMNKRSDVLLRDKHDEALRVMPYLFDDAGYDVTICDPTYAGYSDVPDLSIYDDRPNINAYITMNGKYPVKGFENASTSGQTRTDLMRNFFCYGIFKASPVALQKTLYNNGRYNAADEPKMKQIRESVSKSVGIDASFMQAYGVLDSLTEITEITDSPKGSFLMMVNEATHRPALLEEPNYTPAWSINNTAYDLEHPGRWEGESDVVNNDVKVTHYHINMASLCKVGEWFDYLRESGVYDNTRIIIVSDHAYPLGQNASLVIDNPDAQSGGADRLDLSTFNCMLLVKDFNAKGFTVDDTFMTNADVPSIALSGIVENPVNPFTGHLIESSKKSEPNQHVVYVEAWQIGKNNGNVFLPGNWFSVHDDVSIGSNWTYLGKY